AKRLPASLRSSSPTSKQAIIATPHRRPPLILRLGFHPLRLGFALAPHLTVERGSSFSVSERRFLQHLPKTVADFVSRKGVDLVMVVELGSLTGLGGLRGSWFLPCCRSN
ncbi:hypothetical protein M758_10G179600, partial [Ceratodon purpureus]